MLTAPAAAKPTLVVAPLQSEKENARDARTLTRFLRIYAGQSEAFTLVTPEDMGSIDEELKRQLSGGCDEASCIADIGGALGAQYMITGSLNGLGKRYILTLKLIDIERVRAVRTLAVQARSTEDFADSLPAKIAKLLKRRRSAATTKKRAAKTPVQDAPPPTSLGFFGSPSGATVVVVGPKDFKRTFRLGDRPLTKLSPGTYRWRAATEGFETMTGRLAIGRGSGPKTVRVKLRAFGTLRIDGQLESAVIRVKGPKSLQIPSQMPFVSEGIPSGTYRISVTRKGYESFRGKAIVKLGKQTRLRVRLLELGRLRIDGAVAGAKITVKGPVSVPVTGKMPFISGALPSGLYTVKAQFGGYETWQESFAVTAATRTPVMIRMLTLAEVAKRDRRTRKTRKTIAAVALVLGTVVGASNHLRDAKHEWSMDMAVTADLLATVGGALVIWNW